ncbi:MAG: serine/threonine-protein kinase [Gemmataceae bacterium]
MTPTYHPGICEKYPGAEPLPGYRLLQPLGRGGFGEVWKCEAPGGLPKAIKFVSTSGDQFRQERGAVEQIKTIRHPFLLTLERVELVGAELVMVMELADCQLADRFKACRGDGHPGIPRDELLNYLGDAAEALDMIGSRYGLQHLDVKPENLFLVAGHLKVGDYGLVRRVHRVGEGADDRRGFTPRYTAPEVLRGAVDPRSDQYSLALVYVELATGVFPYPGRTAEQLMLQHATTPPDLAAVPYADRAAVGRALAKNPGERFPSCSAFVAALAETTGLPPEALILPPAATSQAETDEATTPNGPPVLAVTPPPPEPAPFYSRSPSGTPVRPGSGRLSRRREPEPPKPADPFAGLRAVLPVAEFHGVPGERKHEPAGTTLEFVKAVLRAAAEDPDTVAGADDPDATCHFLSTLPAGMVPLKLGMVAERWGMVIDRSDAVRVVLWREAPPDPPKGGKPDPKAPPRPRTGFEVTVRRPVPPSAEYIASGAVCGVPNAVFTLLAMSDLPAILTDVKGVLQNLEERRAHPRTRVERPVRVYPLYQDGVVGAPITGESVDLSASGIRIRTPDAVRTGRMYVEFPGIVGVSGLGVYVRQVRSWQEPGGRMTVTVGRFSSSG